MCRYGAAPFAADRASVRAARDFVRSTLEAWDLESPLDSTLLLTSELVTNAIVHARSAFEVVLLVREGALEVVVRDDEPGLPRARHGGQVGWDAEGGRGLGLLDTVAAEWGAEPVPGGKSVWFRLPTGEGWLPRQGCVCPDQLSELRLTSRPMTVVDMLR